MEYRIILDKPHTKEALVQALTLWLRNVAPVKAKPSPLGKISHSTRTQPLRKLPTLGSTGQHYKVLAPAHDIFSSHQMMAFGGVTIAPGLHLQQTSKLGQQRGHFFLLSSHDLLIIRDPSMFYRWVPLRFNWVNALPSHLLRLTPPVMSSPMSGINVGASSLPIRLPLNDIASKRLTEKLLMAAAVGFEHLPGHLADQVAVIWNQLNTPLGWSTMIAIAVALLLFGEPIALILAAAGAAMALFDLLTQVIDLFRQYYEAAEAAKTQPDIDKAGALFGQALAKGLFDLVDLFFSARQALRAEAAVVRMVQQGHYTPGALLVMLEEVLAKWNRRRMSGQGILVPVMGELPPTTSPNPATTGPGGLLNGPKPRNVPMEGSPKGQGKQGRRPTDDKLKGGKKKSRDKDYGVKDPDFWSWWHRDGKREYGNQDMTRGMMDEVYDDWISRDKPTGQGDKLNKPNR